MKVTQNSPTKCSLGNLLNVSHPAIQQRIDTIIEENPNDEFLCVGATIFHPEDSSPLSLVQVWPQGKGEPVVFWSNADFGLLSGFATFTGSDGQDRALMLMWSTSEAQTLSEVQGGRSAGS